MSVPVSNELWVFLWTICGGVILGFLFDIFRIKRRVVKTGIILITIEDLIYWILAAFIFFLTIFLFNEGQIRGYTIIGFVLGAVFYFSALSPFVLMVSVTVIDGIIYGVKFLVKMLLFPFRMLIKLLGPPLNVAKSGIIFTTGKCGFFIKKGVKTSFRKGTSVLKKWKIRKKNN